jgi:hypothetical protein
MAESSQKRQRLENKSSSYTLTSSYKSKFPKYTTTQYVSNFIIHNLGENPQDEIFHILGEIIDKAFKETIKEYKRDPFMYNIVLDGPSLDTPIALTLYERPSDNLDLEIIMNEIEKLAQSDKLIEFLSNSITVIITVITR